MLNRLSNSSEFAFEKLRDTSVLAQQTVDCGLRCVQQSIFQLLKALLWGYFPSPYPLMWLIQKPACAHRFPLRSRTCGMVSSPKVRVLRERCAK